METRGPEDAVETISQQELEDKLRLGGVDVSLWGKGSAKTIADLHKEILNGESYMSFDGGEVHRYVRVAWVDVFYADPSGTVLRLVEDRQVFKDDRGERRRDISTSLGEKLTRDEDPDEAVIRAVQEELGVSELSSVHNLGYERTKHTPISFPGLSSDYDTYTYAVVLDDLAFSADGYIEDQDDKINYYVWEVVH